jgi:hypothetical protein
MKIRVSEPAFAWGAALDRFTQVYPAQGVVLARAGTAED